MKRILSIIYRFFDKHCIITYITASTVIITWLFNKLWINRRLYLSKVSMQGKTILITGGNTGVGYETVKDLLQRGARVIIACRNLNKGRAAVDKLLSETKSDQANIRLMECDLCSLDSVRTFAKLFNEEEQRLDVLVCNAGVSWSSTIITKDGFNAVMQANYLGHFLLTNLLLDKLKECRPSRIINVSSKVHQGVHSIDWSDAFTQFRSPRWFGAYPASKLFQILSTVKLKQDLSPYGVDVFALTPGWVSTPLSDPSLKAIGWWRFMLSYPIVRCLKFILAKTPKTGAYTVVFCAVEPTLLQSQDVYFQNCKATHPSSLATDQLLTDRLWTLSLKAVQLE